MTILTSERECREVEREAHTEDERVGKDRSVDNVSASWEGKARNAYSCSRTMWSIVEGMLTGYSHVYLGQTRRKWLQSK